MAPVEPEQQQTNTAKTWHHGIGSPKDTATKSSPVSQNLEIQTSDFERFRVISAISYLLKKDGGIHEIQLMVVHMYV